MYLMFVYLTTYARELEIPHFRGVYMRDTLPLYSFNIESDIVNFNTSNQAGSHWMFYYRNKTDIIFRFVWTDYSCINPTISNDR